jgi:hypothetical protein
MIRKYLSSVLIVMLSSVLCVPVDAQVAPAAVLAVVLVRSDQAQGQSSAQLSELPRGWLWWPSWSFIIRKSERLLDVSCRGRTGSA